MCSVAHHASILQLLASRCRINSRRGLFALTVIQVHYHLRTKTIDGPSRRYNSRRHLELNRLWLVHSQQIWFKIPSPNSASQAQNHVASTLGSPSQSDLLLVDNEHGLDPRVATLSC